MINVGTRRPRGLRRGTRVIEVLCKEDRIIYCSPRVQKAYAEKWISANVSHTCQTTLETDAKWFDVEIIMPATFTGSPETGWSHGAMHLALEWSADLNTWLPGNWITTPGSTPETLAGGRKKWFARYNLTPAFWRDTLIDVTLVSDRYGKAITSLTLFGSLITLPNYPYNMSSDAATLQTDLRAEGYTGATVSLVTQPLTARALNYTSRGRQAIILTHSGTSVTSADRNGYIALPNYPYALPSQRALLQTDLRDAGFDYAVVTLHANEWTIFLPDLPCVDQARAMDCIFTPGDPYATWDMFENYAGENSGNFVSSEFTNIRDPLGNPLTEADKAFAHIRLTFP
jgi:hypothetical protein